MITILLLFCSATYCAENTSTQTTASPILSRSCYQRHVIINKIPVLTAEHAAKLKKVKYCIKKEDKTESMHTIKYIYTRNGVELSAQRTLCNNNIFFDSRVKGIYDARTAAVLFVTLQEIYLAENL